MEHAKTSYKFSMTKAGWKGFPSRWCWQKSHWSLYIFWRKKNIKNEKVTNRSHAYKFYASMHDVETLNSFNPKLQLKYTESEIKIN